MKLNTIIEETESTLEIQKNEDLVKALIDGREYVVTASEPESNIFLLKDGNEIHQAFVSINEDGSFLVSIGGNEIALEIYDPRQLRTSLKAGVVDGLVEIKTAMPGKIVKIEVEEGESVSSGDGVIIVEAMKMQNELKSPKDGVVSSIEVSEGDTVEAGSILLRIE